MVEIKARFDEANNITWARQLESAGVHVVYGVAALKTHAKICLVVRREADGIRRYVHIGSRQLQLAHGATLHGRRPVHRGPARSAPT